MFCGRKETPPPRLAALEPPAPSGTARPERPRKMAAVHVRCGGSRRLAVSGKAARGGPEPQRTPARVNRVHWLSELCPAHHQRRRHRRREAAEREQTTAERESARLETHIERCTNTVNVHGERTTQRNGPAKRFSLKWCHKSTSHLCLSASHFRSLLC